MKTTISPILISFMCCLGFMTEAKGDQWELEFDKDGTRVYTQLDGSSPYKQVKVTTTINAPLENVLEILKAFRQYKNWMYQVDESYLINQIDSAYYIFMLEDEAWPIQNRYHVTRMEFKESLTRSFIEFQSVQDYIEKRSDAIQVKQYEGYWALESRAENQCALEFVLTIHPGGHVPAWLSNFHVTERPFQNVVQLKELAELSVIRP